jgi:hypothetical protein
MPLTISLACGRQHLDQLRIQDQERGMFGFACLAGKSRRLSASALAIAMIAASSPTVAQRAAATAEGGFAALAGTWSGGGTISTSGGSTERIRCRVSYAVSPSGSGLNQDLRCASDSYNFQVSSNIQNQGGALSGTWTEVTRNATGSVSGRMSGGTIQVAVTGPAFTAGLSIDTRGNKQSVSIRPRGADITDVSVSLTRN